MGACQTKLKYLTVTNIIQLIENLIHEKKRPIIGITGHHGAGKTEFIRYLMNLLEKQSILSYKIECDWFFYEDSLTRRRQIDLSITQNNMELYKKLINVRDWYDWDGITENLLQIKRLGLFRVNDAWNQKTGYKDLSINYTIPNNAVIFCEGHFILDGQVRGVLDAVLMVDENIGKCLDNVIIRDIQRKSKERILRTAYYYHSQLSVYFDMYGDKCNAIVRKYFDRYEMVC